MNIEEAIISFKENLKNKGWNRELTKQEILCFVAGFNLGKVDGVFEMDEYILSKIDEVEK